MQYFPALLVFMSSLYSLSLHRKRKRKRILLKRPRPNLTDSEANFLIQYKDNEA